MSDSNDGPARLWPRLRMQPTSRRCSLFQIEESLVLLAESSEANGLTRRSKGRWRLSERSGRETRSGGRVHPFCEGWRTGEGGSEAPPGPAKAFEAAAERVSSMVLRFLEWLGAEKLEGRTNTLKKRKCPPS